MAMDSKEALVDKEAIQRSKSAIKAQDQSNARRTSMLTASRRVSYLDLRRNSAMPDLTILRKRTQAE